MDAAGVGALIGIGTLAAVFLCIKLHDIWEQRKQQPSQSTPLLLRIPPQTQPFQMQPNIQIFRQHSKMNMILPKEESKKSTLMR